LIYCGGGRGSAVPSIYLAARWRWVGGQGLPLPVYPQERAPVPIVQEAQWALESVWAGAERRKSTPQGLEHRIIQLVATAQDVVV
jgi:hypothetical protein